MRLLALVLRFVAFVFNLVLCLGLFFLALLVMPSGKHNIQLAVVPLTGSRLTHTLLIASICGFVAMVLALRQGRAARFPMLLWNLLIFALLVSAPFRGQFSFQGRDQLTTGVYVCAASLLALLGSWLQWSASERARRMA